MAVPNPFLQYLQVTFPKAVLAQVPHSRAWSFNHPRSRSTPYVISPIWLSASVSWQSYPCRSPRASPDRKLLRGGLARFCPSERIELYRKIIPWSHLFRVKDGYHILVPLL